jgi:hypothetical protein
VRNNWRITRKAPQIIQGQRYRLTDILWWTRPSDILAEIASILDLPTVDTNTPGWINHRLPATKNILDRMSDDEKSILMEQAENYHVEGLPSEVQRK